MKKDNLIKLIALFVLSGLFFVSCEKEKVSLTIWVDDNNKDVIENRLNQFAKKHSKQAVFDFIVEEKGAAYIRSELYNAAGKLPDVFVYVDNQFTELYRRGYLKELNFKKRDLIDACGGEDSEIVKAASVNGKLYAYPEMNSNGYFMYYNKKYFAPIDLESFERMAEVAAENEVNITMDLQNGWYLYSFFKAAGLNVESTENDFANVCNWNASDTKYTGVDVCKAIMALNDLPGFVSKRDTEFFDLVKNNKIVAGVNGAWNASKIKEIWKADYGACKLPTVKINGDDLQLHSFAGYKFASVSAISQYSDWAEKVCEWITNEESQIEISRHTGECPANLKAAQSEYLKSSPAVLALLEQQPFSHPQRVYRSLWQPAEKLGYLLTEKNTQEKDLQQILNEITAEICER